MKRLFTLLIEVVLTVSVFAQSPQKMSYQAVIRNTSGGLVQSNPIGMQISILQGSTSGIVVYSETHTTSTNINGLVNIEIGAGTPVTGTFTDINWANGPYYIKTETDPSGGTNYTISGVNQVLSVPYSFLAKNTETKQTLSLIGNDLSISGGNTISLPSGSNFWQQSGSDIYFSAGKVGIWTSTPLTALTIAENANTSITYPLYIQNASGDWTETEKGVGLKFGRLNPTSGHDYGTIRATIASGSGGDGRLQFIGGGGNDPHMTINHLGNVGIGTINPGNKLDVNGGITSSGLTISNLGTQSGLTVYKSDNSTDQKSTELLSIGADGNFIGRFVNDAYTQAEHWLNVARNTGTYTVKSVSFPNGNVGIGTTTPEFRLTLDKGATNPDGGILAIGGSEGEGATLTTSGSGTRLIWYPKKAAFRAGHPWNDEWDDANIGWSSIAFGERNKAAGRYSIAMGSISTASADGTISMGLSVTASAPVAMVIGQGSSSVLENNIGHSLMIGFLSTIPTLFVGPGVGPGTLGKVGIGTTSPDQLLSVNGNASKSGGGSWATYSDIRLKTVHNDFIHGLSDLMQLKPVYYNYKKENPLNIRDEGEHVGFVAQDVQRIIPEAVSENDKGYLMLNNDPILWTMLNSIKELKAENDALKAEFLLITNEIKLLKQQKLVEDK